MRPYQKIETKNGSTSKGLSHTQVQAYPTFLLLNLEKGRYTM